MSRQSELMQKRRAELQKTMSSWKEDKMKDARWKQAQEAARAKLKPQPEMPPAEEYLRITNPLSREWEYLRQTLMNTTLETVAPRRSAATRGDSRRRVDFATAAPPAC